ncbi:MAG: thrombospondin type 3 repeat-containing protein [Kofleriaceae bacterium]
MRALVVLAGLTGCFAPAAPLGAPCGDGEERCPAGQLCVTQPGGLETCELTDDTDPPNDFDSDGDGIIDLVDNCPDVPNTDQSDEEGDGLGDVCDPCPPFDDNSDQDGDGVGDACDPNPDQEGDRLVAFEGFALGLPSTWVTSGMFIAAGGEGFAMAGDSVTTLATFPSPDSKRIEIRAVAMVIRNNAKVDNLGAINLVERMQPNTDKAVACQLSALGTGGQQQLRIFDLAAGVVVDTASHTFTTPSEVDLRLRRDGDGYSCRATSPSLELAGTSTFSPMSPRIGLRVRGVDALFHWVMIVTSP